MTFKDILGESVEIRQQIILAEKAAAVDLPVLITGETGTGKEMFAKAIHCAGKRAGKPFIAENCSAVPGSLAESVFFGSEKGAYTQATFRVGLFELAKDGTLLLDELNSMPFELQPKLLRALQEGTVRRLGGTAEIPVNARVIAIVNEEPEELIRTARLRKDLYYRLNVIRISVPPLRAHRNDIPLYVDFFIKKYNEKYCKAYEGITTNAMAELKQREYPGNVRELENIIEGAVAMGGGSTVLKLKDLYI